MLQRNDSIKDPDAVFDMLDTNGDGVIDREEFESGEANGVLDGLEAKDVASLAELAGVQQGPSEFIDDTIDFSSQDLRIGLHSYGSEERSQEKQHALAQANFRGLVTGPESPKSQGASPSQPTGLERSLSPISSPVISSYGRGDLSDRVLNRSGVGQSKDLGDTDWNAKEVSQPSHGGQNANAAAGLSRDLEAKYSRKVNTALTKWKRREG